MDLSPKPGRHQAEQPTPSADVQEAHTVQVFGAQHLREGSRGSQDTVLVKDRKKPLPVLPELVRAIRGHSIAWLRCSLALDATAGRAHALHSAIVTQHAR